MLYMKNANKWLVLLAFLAGALMCYVGLQFQFFIIDFELSIVDTLLAIGTLIIGVYIAHTIQRNLNKGQNQYSYIEGKFDVLWTEFINFSTNFIYADVVDISTITSYFKNASPSIDFIRSIFESFGINAGCIEDLEKQMDAFENYLVNCPVSDNSIQVKPVKDDIDTMVLEINKCFKAVLKNINQL